MDKDQSFIRIYDLEEGGRYKVWINAASSAGHSEDSEPMYSTVIDRSMFIFW